MKVTIIIEDNADGRSCNAAFNFSPALKRTDPPTPAVRCFHAAFAAIQEAASNIKATEIITRTDS